MVLKGIVLFRPLASPQTQGQHRMLRAPGVAYAFGYFAWAPPRIKDKAELAELPHAPGHSVHRPSHAYRELNIGHIREVAEAIKHLLLPVSEVLRN